MKLVNNKIKEKFLSESKSRLWQDGVILNLIPYTFGYQVRECIYITIEQYFESFKTGVEQIEDEISQ